MSEMTRGAEMQRNVVILSIQLAQDDIIDLRLKLLYTVVDVKEQIFSNYGCKTWPCKYNQNDDTGDLLIYAVYI